MGCCGENNGARLADDGVHVIFGDGMVDLAGDVLETTPPAQASLGSGQKTVSMSLARALTYKKRVAERLKQVETDVTAYNSIVNGQEREVDVQKLIDERNRLVNHMIDLKLAIQEANGPIQREILSLAELKSENDFYRRIPTNHGVRQNQFAYDPSQPATFTYDAVIRKADVDSAVKSNNSRIDATQERIEAHNHTAHITVEDIGLFS